MELVECQACGSKELVTDNGMAVCVYCRSRYVIDSATHSGLSTPQSQQAPPPESHPPPPPAPETRRVSRRSLNTALVLSIFLGFYGVDRFYLGYIGMGFVKLFTAGGLGVLWIIDIIRIATKSLNDADGLPLA